jgi:crotonobetainyl-CoA:carnitine CoA-transferase CaiB-like acyl-CoA transferase
MTANELADWIENGAPFGSYEGAKKAVIMLRQQDKEISELRKFISLDEYRKTEWYAYELDNEMKRYKKASEK